MHFSRLLAWVVVALNAAGTALIIVLSLLVNADILGRGLFAHPIYGVTEFASLALVAIVFLQLGAATTSDKLTRSDLLIMAVGRRSPRAASAIQAFYDLCALALFLALAYASWQPLARAWTRNDYIGVVGMGTLPTWPVRAIILISAVLMTIHFAIRITAGIRGALGLAEPVAIAPSEVSH